MKHRRRIGKANVVVRCIDALDAEAEALLEKAPAPPRRTSADARRIERCPGRGDRCTVVHAKTMFLVAAAG